MTQAMEKQVAALSTLVLLQKRVREAGSKEELGFAIVNDTLQLSPYRQAVLWHKDMGIMAVSGLPDVDRNSPYAQWISGLFKHLPESGKIRVLTPDDLPGSISDRWSDWLPESVIVIPLKSPQHEDFAGCLLLAREAPFQEYEIALFEEISGLYGYGLAHLMSEKGIGRKSLDMMKRKTGRISAALLLAILLSLPVRISVLAPAEIAPRNPVLVRVPISGVVDRFYIRPNDPVKKGQLLFDLDATDLKNQLDIAQKVMLVAQAEYRRTANRALTNTESKMELAVRKGVLEEKAAEVKYYTDQLERVKVVAPEDGIAVFSDVNDWIGRPVAIGEKVISIADPGDIEITIHMPMADAIPIEENASMKLFLNVAPNHPIDGRIFYVSYRANPTEEGILAYTVKGRMEKEISDPPRIGLSGTAKIYGRKSSLFYYLFRRPISSFRQWFGV